MDLGLLAIGVGIVALSLLGAGLGMGMAVSKAMEAVGRQPEDVYKRQALRVAVFTK